MGGRSEHWLGNRYFREVDNCTGLSHERKKWSDNHGEFPVEWEVCLRTGLPAEKGDALEGVLQIIYKVDFH